LQQKLETTSGSDLAALAREFGLTTAEVVEYTRGGGGALGVSADLTGVVFSDNVIKDQRIGGPVALADDRMVIVKVLEHRMPRVRPLAEVRGEVEAAVRKEEGTRAARSAADLAVKQLKAGSTLDEVAKGLAVTAVPATHIGRGDPQPPAQVREAAFAAPLPGTKPIYEAIALDEGGAAILAVISVKPGASGANPANDQQLVSRVSQRIWRLILRRCSVARRSRRTLPYSIDTGAGAARAQSHARRRSTIFALGGHDSEPTRHPRPYQSG
jgi:peptidyl-prolyl cis-trans isomerase D